MSHVEVVLKFLTKHGEDMGKHEVRVDGRDAYMI